MNDPVFEVIMNGTNAAVQSGQISHNEAEALNKEAMRAATLDVEHAISDSEASAAQL